MNPYSLQSQLGQLESQLTAVSDAVLQTNTADLLNAASELQTVAVAFSTALSTMALELKASSSHQHRVQAIAAKLVSLRDALARQNIGVERALAALIPASQACTYAPKTGFSAASPYGSAGRRSGEFKAFSA